MMKKAFLFAPLAASILMVGCSGNSTSSTFNNSAVVTPSVIDKSMSAVEWTAANEAEMASHVYRVFANSENLSLGFSTELNSASLTTLAELFRVAGNRSCNISGSLKTENIAATCYDAVGGNKVDCEATSALIEDDTQLSLATACQDGDISARYLDGYFNITSRDDFSDEAEIRKSSIFSAVGDIPKLNANGVQDTNNDGDPLTETITDYQLKTSSYTYFYDHSYETYVDLTTDLTGLDACIGERTSVLARQGIRSDELGGMEEKGNAGFPYYRLTNLSMAATPEHSCDGAELKTTITYDVNATIESAALGGGGEDAATTVSWPDSYIPQVVTTGSYPKGTMTLTHKNAAGDYVVVVEFDETNGTVTVSPSEAHQQVFATVADFIGLSEPEPETEE